MYDELACIAQEEFGDIVNAARVFHRRTATPLKLRLLIRDGTFVDIWLSPEGSRYAYHWEQRAVRGLIHCHDNAPDHPEISTFPKHFHDGREDIVKPSDISDDPPTALREHLTLVRERLQSLDE